MHFKVFKNCHIRNTFGRLGRQNERQTVARFRCALQNVKKNCHVRNTFGRLGRQNEHQTVARARCALQNVQKRSRNTFGRLGRQNVHQTVARARCALQNVQKLSHSEHFWKIRSAKCAPDCNESSMCTSKCSKTVTFGTLLEDWVGKMCTRL